MCTYTADYTICSGKDCAEKLWKGGNWEDCLVVQKDSSKREECQRRPDKAEREISGSEKCSSCESKTS